MFSQYDIGFIESDSKGRLESRTLLYGNSNHFQSENVSSHPNFAIASKICDTTYVCVCVSWLLNIKRTTANVPILFARFEVFVSQRDKHSSFGCYSPKNHSLF